MDNPTESSVTTRSCDVRIDSVAKDIAGAKAHSYRVQIFRLGMWLTIKTYTVLNPAADPDADSYAYECARELKQHIQQDEKV